MAVCCRTSKCFAMAKRLVQTALSRALGQGSAAQSRPGSASHMDYKSARRMSQRFECKANSSAGFVELAPEFPWTAEDLYEELERVPGVRKVSWQTTKTSQGNVGDHRSERNILVYSSLARLCQPLEFEVTRNNQKKDRHAPFTVTVCFKEPPRDWVAKAWRILSHVCAGK